MSNNVKFFETPCITGVSKLFFRRDRFDNVKVTEGQQRSLKKKVFLSIQSLVSLFSSQNRSDL